MAQRCRSPPESAVTGLSAKAAVLVTIMHSSATAQSWGRSTPKRERCGARPISTTSRTEKSKCTVLSCATTASRRARRARGHAIDVHAIEQHLPTLRGQHAS